MQAEETKMILRYFGGIEAQLDDVNIELAELRDRYNPIKGIAMYAARQHAGRQYRVAGCETGR